MLRQLILTIPFLISSVLFSFSFQSYEVHAQGGEQLLPDPGVVSYTFRNQFDEDMPGTLDMIKEMGITNIEFSSLFGHSAEEVRQMLDERGMVATSYGVGYDALVNDTDEVAEDAKTLGARFVRVAWIPHDGQFDIEDARRAVRDFTEAGKKLSEHGIRFAYHNHGFEFRPYGDGTLYDYMVQNSDPEYVNFQMDTFWVAQPGHDPVELLRKYPDRFLLVHLKDLTMDAEHNYSGRAPSEYDVPLGTGQIDFEEFLRVAQSSSIEYFYIEDESADVADRVPLSREYLLSITE
jgi:sugar phosphate isomerase/epimerase